MEYSGTIPKLFIEKKDCCGCSACYSVCPSNAISMEEDSEGFFYPLIDSKSCIHCYACLRICPIKKINIDTIVS